MVIGFGGTENPYKESIELLEELSVEFITDLTRKAIVTTKNNKITVDNVLNVVRDDYKKSSRVVDLLRISEKIKEAKKRHFGNEHHDEQGRSVAE